MDERAEVRRAKIVFVEEGTEMVEFENYVDRDLAIAICRAVGVFCIDCPAVAERRPGSPCSTYKQGIGVLMNKGTAKPALGAWFVVDEEEWLRP